MDSPLTPGMSSLLYFGDETFEYPALENGATPGTKDRYGGYTFEQRDLDSLEAGHTLLNDFDSSRTFTASKAAGSGPSAYAQTPALTTGPSVVNPNSSSISQASPSVAPDYFSRPRQPNSDGSSAHFVTAKPVESSDFSEFRNAINKRFNRAREVVSSVQRYAYARLIYLNACLNGKKKLGLFRAYADHFHLEALSPTSMLSKPPSMMIVWIFPSVILKVNSNPTSINMPNFWRQLCNRWLPPQTWEHNLVLNPRHFITQNWTQLWPSMLDKATRDQHHCSNNHTLR